MNRRFFPTSGLCLTLGLLLFLWLPLFVVYSRGLFSFHWASIEAWRSVLSHRALGLLCTTAIIGLGTTFCSLAVSVPAGYFSSRACNGHGRIWRFGCLAPILIPPHINAMVWEQILGEKGLLNRSLMHLLGLDKPFINILSMGGAVFILTLSYFPYLTLFVMSGMLALDPSLEDAGLLSMNQRNTFMRIILPFIRPYLLAGSIVVFVFSIANYGVPALLGVRTYPVEIFAEFSTFFNTDRAIMTSLPLLFLITGCMVWYWRIMRGQDFAVLSPRGLAADARRTGAQQLGSFFLGTVVFLSVVVPVLWLLWASRSPRSYLIVLETAWLPMLATLALSIGAASAATMLGFAAGYLMVRVRTPAISLLDLLSLLPLAIPGAILGMGMIRLWNRPGVDFVYGSPAILILAYLAQFFPFALRCIIPAIRQIGSHLEESYLMHHPGWFRRQWHITAPLAKQGLALAWIVVFVLCMGELNVTLLVIPPGMETLALRIYNLMHYGAQEIVAALSVVLLLLTIVPLTLIFWKRQNRPAAQQRTPAGQGTEEA